MHKTAFSLAGALIVLAASTSIAQAFEDGAIVIWQDDRAPDLLTQIGAQFEADLGIRVIVENVDPLTDRFQQAAATGDGPDIVMWAHDRLGEWAAGGLIAPVSPSASVVEANLESAWEAVTFDNRVWGYPVAVEAIGLVYNRDLVETPPENFEDIAEMDLPEGVTPIMWAYNDTYFTFPMLAANGGYAFEMVDGSYDGSQTGVNTEGAIQGGEVLADLIESETMPRGVDYGVMEGAFANGEVAMIINGPWSWSGYEEAGIDIGVASLPAVAGSPSRPFLGVQALALNAASPNRDLAVEFIENYLLTDENIQLWNSTGALGVPTDISVGAAEDDDKIVQTLANAEVGVPMPSNPEMGAFWSAMEPALGNITSGATSVEQALNDAAARILGE
ncbi:maltose/maltodextrin ABC transporter substrate-binding protein MalE [Pelagibacterium halotolerans]|uniref:Maltodextrin-binding protein n=1 Tax=Pelagibacterium halotolerans (strain DSM 22347 / JCM 15775 / CGMCC 1.7692 / B2) TaxID=1082931 RepID=G4RAA5_PELHB|nr:maltose/maltodextrin ABC transporter substrate-binding protein MalE [Pelagibacterium halotolerans]AEQ50464.1 maltose/maltodextrin ABC transporter, substrate binding periplasmic protein MalE [Pelagibacterium halotolerans B2]QJR19574.1 maltose/maltodextrin ABC transporter substrate-binding protein MalE [Pelagibacterium halotolerans]SDZ87613.1 maltooligosaccharide-binding protein [Pelagibacterium halotolerans]